MKIKDRSRANGTSNRAMGLGRGVRLSLGVVLIVVGAAVLAGLD